MNQEQNLDDVLNVLKEAKKQMAELHDAVDPVSSTGESLRRVEKFLNEIEKEVVRVLPAQREKTFKEKLFSSLTLLVPVVTLLKELLATAKHVIELLQR